MGQVKCVTQVLPSQIANTEKFYNQILITIKGTTADID